MDSAIIKYIGSYDFLGKSIPGAVLSIGIYLLLPPQSELLVDSPFAAIEIVSGLVILLIVGLMIGQGVHTLADNFEKSFLWIGIRLSHSYEYLKVFISNLGYNPFLKYNSIISKEDFSSKRESILYDWIKSTDKWIRKRYWGGYDALIGHRYLFGKSIEWNYAKYDDYRERNRRWSEREKGVLYDRFIFAYLNIYKEDIRFEEPDEIATKYPLITTRLSNYDQLQHRNFQAIYSFCRSMWVVFLLLATSSTLVILNLFLFGGTYEPIGLLLVPDWISYWIPVILTAVSLLFLDASGTYKRHFIEYMIAEFIVSEEIHGDIVNYEKMEMDPNKADSVFSSDNK